MTEQQEIVHGQLRESVALERRNDAPAFDMTTPMGLIAMAAQRGASIEQMAQLWSLKKEMDADEAKKAFHAAMAQFKATPPQITKNKHVKYQTSKGVTEYDHATLDHVCDKIIEGLAAVGVSHKWKTRQDGPKISVSCVLTHSKGHSEEGDPLSAGSDDTGSKNSIQAIGSTITYLQRYTLLSATGMAAGGQDTDGRSPQASSEGMSEGEFQRYCGLIENAQGIPILKATYEAAQRDAGEDAGAKKSFLDLKDKRYRELKNAGN